MLRFLILGFLSVCLAATKLPSEAVSDCDVCRDSAKSFKKIIDDKSVQTEVKGWLTMLCNSLGGDRAKDCNKYLDEYYMNTIQYLDLLLTNQCDGYWGYCYNAAKCKVCKAWAASIKSIIDDKNAQKTIKGWFVTYCNDLPGTSKTKCLDNVDKDFADAIKNLDDRFTDYCSKTAGVCRQQSDVERQSFTELIASYKDLVQFGVGNDCKTCQASSVSLKKLVDDKDNQDQVKTWMRQVCNSLPKKASNQCNGYITKLFDYWVQLLDFYIDNACDWGVCYNADHCKTCKDVTYEIKVIVDKPSNQDDAKAWILRYCNGLPGDYKSDCKDAVNNYFPLITSLVDYALNVFCSMLGVCKEIGL